MPGVAAPSNDANAREPHLTDAAALLLLCGLCFFWRLGYPGLFDFNEGLYVEAAREMLLRGDAVTGSVNGIPFYDKPPLALWLAALAFRAFGVSEWSARLPVALAASATALVVYWMGRAALGRMAGLCAAAFMCLSPLFLGTARHMTMDIHQTWWVSAALACFLVTQRAQCRLRRLWVAGFWACCGLGFMSKSFPGLLPIPIAGAFLLVAARWRVRAFACAIWNLHPLPGLVVLAAVIVPWHWLAYRDFGAYFVDQYWTQHHVGLLKATEYDHAQPVWYYIPGLLAGFFPWSLLLPSIRFAAGDFAPDTDAGRVRLLAVVWAALTFVAFSAMRSKLVSYLLPMYPACALLAASVVARAAESRRGLRVALPLGVGGILTLAVLLTTVFILAPEARRTTDPEAIAIATPGMFAFAYGALVSIAVGLLGGALQAVRDPARGAAVASTGMAVFVGLCGAVGIPEYDRAVNAPLRQAVAEASRRTSNEEPLVVHIGRPRRPSVFYYLPERLVARPLGRPTPGAFLVEQWDRALVRHDVASRPSTLVLADFRHGAETLPTATVVYRSGRWALFRARGSEAGSSP